jgi:hypothetical protein
MTIKGIISKILLNSNHHHTGLKDGYNLSPFLLLGVSKNPYILMNRQGNGKTSAGKPAANLTPLPS